MEVEGGVQGAWEMVDVEAIPQVGKHWSGGGQWFS